MRRGGRRSPPDPSLTVGQEALEILRNPRSNAASLSRTIERAPRLLEAILAYAQARFRDRGRIRNTQDAIILIGLTQVERVIVHHLRRATLQGQGDNRQINHRIAALQVAPPGMLPAPGTRLTLSR